MKRNSQNTNLEIYHGVPEGWSKSEILKLYEKLNGKNQISVEEATEPGAPSWLPDRYNWLQYRAALFEIGELVRVGDKAAIEIAVRYIELDYFGSYSGFIKERFARLLKCEVLSEEQKGRLVSHFSELITSQECLQEFRQYAKLLNNLRAQKNA